MSRPQLFLSAVSEELKTARGIAAATLHRLGYDPVSQDNFPTGYGELCAWLREQIDRCEGLMQLVGHGYGAEPPDEDPEFGRVSYTQYELLYARSKGKKTWLIFVQNGYPGDKCQEHLDLPSDSRPDPSSYQADRKRLQQDYIARLHAENHLRHYVGNENELKLKIHELRNELAILREKYDNQLNELAVGIRKIHEDVQQAAEVSADKIRGHLLQTIEETHRRELAEAEEAADWKERERLREAATTAHAARLSRIEDLVVAFAEIERGGTATAVFREMDRILREQGVDGAIAYVETQRSSIIETVRARVAAVHERNQADLQPLLQTAFLYQTKGQVSSARDLYADILAAEPDWPEALHENFRFLVEEGDVARIRTTLTQACRDYEEAHQRARRLTVIEPSNTEWQHDLSVSYDDLGDVAKAQGNLEDAATAYREGLAIRKKLAAMDPGNTRWQRDLSISYNKLGDVAVAQDRLDDAAKVYGDGLEIRKKLATIDPSNTRWQRDLSISYNKLGDVAAAQGKLDDAASAYADGLEIRKKRAAMDPSNTRWQRDLSISYNKLGDVAAAQGKLVEAAWAYRDGLEIRKTLADSDPSNTRWQRDLSISYNRLGDVAAAQGRLDDAAKAYRDDLAIAKKLAAMDPGNTEWQRDLAVSYYKLGFLAERQKRADEAQAYWKQALGQLTSIEKRGLHLSPEDRKWLEILRGKVGADAK